MRPAVLPILLALVSLPASVTAYTLTGRVVDANTGEPIAARIEVTDPAHSTTADATGRFTIDLDGPGAVTLVVSLPGYYPLRQPVAPGTGEIEVRLAPIVSLTDRVEVTATRAREGVDPVSFTNVTQEQVAEAYWAQDPAMLLSQVVPGVYATNDNGHGIGYSYFAIRGFGQARTRVMLNGAPLNDAESGELFFIDLADFLSTAGDVQVQRGVFGLSGLGGAVDITTASPSVTPQLHVHTGVGSYGTRRLNVTWQSGLFGGGWSLAARYSNITTDGYRDDSWVDMWNYYAALARYGQKSRLRLVVFGGPEDTHLAYAGIPQAALDGAISGDADRDRRLNPLTFTREVDHFFQPHYQFLHDVQLSEATRFSQTAYVFQGKGYYDQFRRNRWLFEYALPEVVAPDGTVITRSDLQRRRSVDEWDAGWVPSLTRQAGLLTLELDGEVRVHRAHHFGRVIEAAAFPQGIPSDHRYYDYRVAKNTAAVAVGGRFAATARLALTGGLQFTHHEYEMSRDRLKNVTFSRRYDFVLPRAGAVLALGEGTNAYVGIARGMREPFFRNLYDPQDYYAPPPAFLDPEDVWNVELGTSVQRPGWRVRGNVFWMRFLNEIVYAGAIDDNGVPVYGNGATSRRVGLEADGSVALSPHVGLDAALSWSSNRFLSYREFDWEGGSAVYDANPIAGFPDLMASVTARFQWHEHRASVAARRVGRFHLDTSGREDRVNPAYGVVDVAANLALPASVPDALGLSRIYVDLRCNNLFDARYTTFGYVEEGVPLFIPAAGRNLYVGVTFRR
jgi:iron complex outermembrane receptor protein